MEIDEIKNTIAEYFDKLDEMGIPMQLKPFGKGYRLEIGNIHIYFENEKLTYTGWGIDFGAEQHNPDLSQLNKKGNDYDNK